jgi:hypothetical protein
MHAWLHKGRNKLSCSGTDKNCVLSHTIQRRTQRIQHICSLAPISVSHWAGIEVANLHINWKFSYIVWIVAWDAESLLLILILYSSWVYWNYFTYESALSNEPARERLKYLVYLRDYAILYVHRTLLQS